MSVIISTDLVINPLLADQPLTHARIGYDSILTIDNITASSAEAGYPASAIVNKATYERWKATALPASITIDAGVAVDVDYVAIAAHTLGSSVSTVTVESSTDGASWTQRDQFTPGDDSAIMALFAEVSARYWRITITGSTIPLVGVVYVGKSLAMQRSIYGGHSPLNLSRVTAVKPSISETGQWLGSSQERLGLKTSYAWKNLTAAWYRANFDPFVATNPRANPFFIAWRPADFPQEVGYCWATGDIRPSNSGTVDFMSVSMDVEGFLDA